MKRKRNKSPEGGKAARQESVLERVLDLLASNKLAVVLLVVLSAVMAVATFLESKYDSQTARHMVYGAWWFEALLLVLGLNVMLALLNRYPWKRTQIGFVLAHIGILVVLAASLITRVWGVEGMLTLHDGRSANSIVVSQPLLMFGPSQQDSRQLPVEFRWDPPREGHVYRFNLSHGVVAVVDRYFHHATEVKEVQADPNGGPAVRVSIGNARMRVGHWLTAADPVVQMGPARLQLQLASDRAEAKEMLASMAGLPSGGSVTITLGSYSGTIPVDRLTRGPVKLGGTGYSANVEGVFQRLGVQGNSLVDRSGGPLNPAVRLEISDHKGDSRSLLLFALHPRFNMPLGSAGDPAEARATYHWSQGRGAIDLIAVKNSQQIFYRLDSGHTGTLTPGQDVATGWMDLRLSVDRYLPRAKLETSYREAAKTRMSEGDPSVIRVALKGSDDPGPYWMHPGESVTTTVAGGSPLWFAYGMKNLPLGFAVKLIKFSVGTDPGTSDPSSYKSLVAVGGKHYTIRMNHPLEYNGYKLYQASYEMVNGKPVISVLSVAKNPGISLTYVGSIFIVAGIAVMIYQRSRSARAARRSKAMPRPTRNERAPQPVGAAGKSRTDKSRAKSLE